MGYCTRRNCMYCRLFDALYLVTCMPSLSTASLVVILMVDLVQTTNDLLELHQCTQSILPRLHTAVNYQDNAVTHSLLSTVRLLCYTSEVLRKQNFRGIQVRSCIPHELSDDDKTLLEKMERRISVTWVSGKSSQNSSRRIYTPDHVLTAVTIPGRVRSIIAVQPIMFATKQPRVDDIGGWCDEESRFRCTSIVDCSDVLQEALGVLWTSECFILAEYAEIIVPVLYGTFMLATVHLPSAQYHTEMVGVTRDNVESMVSIMFIYALLELLSLIFLAGIMKLNCSIDALYQLAFVLETQMQFILSKLWVWMMFTLTYRVAHFGADFSFKFDWIKDNC